MGTPGGVGSMFASTRNDSQTFTIFHSGHNRPRFQLCMAIIGTAIKLSKHTELGDIQLWTWAMAHAMPVIISLGVRLLTQTTNISRTRRVNCQRRVHAFSLQRTPVKPTPKYRPVKAHYHINLISMKSGRSSNIANTPMLCRSPVR